MREVAEESGVALPDPRALVRFSRWITPAEVRIRFDTHFFLVAAPEDAEPRPDGSETVDVGWYAPREALDAYGRGELELVFPTIKTLEQLAGFGTADELLAWADGRVGRADRAAGGHGGRGRPHRAAGRAGLSRLSRSPSPSPARRATSAARSCAPATARAASGA